MYKPLNYQELEDLLAQVERGAMSPETVKAIVDTLVPRLIATVRAKDAEIKRVSGMLADELADELLDSTPVPTFDDDPTLPITFDTDGDFDLYDGVEVVPD